MSLNSIFNNAQNVLGGGGKGSPVDYFNNANQAFSGGATNDLTNSLFNNAQSELGGGGQSGGGGGPVYGQNDTNLANAFGNALAGAMGPSGEKGAAGAFNPDNAGQDAGMSTVDDPTGVSRWVLPGSMQSGQFSIDSNGTIYFPGLRDAQQSFLYRFDAGPDGLQKIQDGKLIQLPYVKINLIPIDIRLTVALPCDHRMFCCVKSKNDPTQLGSLVADDKAQDYDRIATDFERVYHYSAGSLYRKQMRQSGDLTPWPIPEAADENAKNFASGIIYDDSKMLENHARKKAREMLRLDRGGESLGTPHIIDAANVGDMIEKLSTGALVRACVQAITYTFDESGGQKTERHLG